jgi:hypothetical protein
MRSGQGALAMAEGAIVFLGVFNRSNQTNQTNRFLNLNIFGTRILVEVSPTRKIADLSVNVSAEQFGDGLFRRTSSGQRPRDHALQRHVI